MFTTTLFVLDLFSLSQLWHTERNSHRMWMCKTCVFHFYVANSIILCLMNENVWFRIIFTYRWNTLLSTAIYMFTISQAYTFALKPNVPIHFHSVIIAWIIHYLRSHLDKIASFHLKWFFYFRIANAYRIYISIIYSNDLYRENEVMPINHGAKAKRKKETTQNDEEGKTVASFLRFAWVRFGIGYMTWPNDKQ